MGFLSFGDWVEGERSNLLSSKQPFLPSQFHLPVPRQWHSRETSVRSVVGSQSESALIYCILFLYVLYPPSLDCRVSAEVMSHVLRPYVSYDHCYHIVCADVTPDRFCLWDCGYGYERFSEC